MTTPAIDVLRCPSCHAAIPFGDADPATCVFCGASVPLPPEQRALRDANRADADARRSAEAYLHKLASPPSELSRYLARENVSWFVLIFIGVFMVASYIVAFIIDDIVRLLFLHGKSEIWWAWFDSIVAFLALSTFVLLGATGRRRSLGRDRLLAALAAKPPQQPGGPACCRACGAPLFLYGGALGARCTYCSADNVVVPGLHDAHAKLADRANVRSAMKYAKDIERADWQEVRSAFIVRCVLLCLPGLAYFMGPINMQRDLDDPYRVQRESPQRQIDSMRSLRTPFVGSQWNDSPSDAVIWSGSANDSRDSCA